MRTLFELGTFLFYFSFQYIVPDHYSINGFETKQNLMLFGGLDEAWKKLNKNDV